MNPLALASACLSAECRVPEAVAGPAARHWRSGPCARISDVAAIAARARRTAAMPTATVARMTEDPTLLVADDDADVLSLVAARRRAARFSDDCATPGGPAGARRSCRRSGRTRC